MNMTNRIIHLIINVLMLMTMTCIGDSQVDSRQPLRLMFYNVENLFDTFDNPQKDDNDFLPGGKMRWNVARYNKKINSLYKTIVAAGKWNPPGIVAMCEVENRQVLKDLINNTYLSKFNFRIIHEESPDLRGIDVCLIYQTDLVANVDYKYWIPSVIEREKFSSRSVLYAKFVSQKDTFHLIVNHWPSRRGGVLAGEDIRQAISDMIREKADSIIKSTAACAKIIIAGDFNCTPDDQEIRSLVAPSLSNVVMLNLSAKKAEEGEGTYRYMGTWEMLDQVMISEGLLNCRNGFHSSADMLTVFKPDFLLKKDPRYPGFTPLSTYRGYRYQGGYSDHLPVLLDLEFR